MFETDRDQFDIPHAQLVYLVDIELLRLVVYITSYLSYLHHRFAIFNETLYSGPTDITKNAANNIKMD